MVLNYAVYKLDIDDIENSSDWFDKDGCLKYKENYLFKTLCESGALENAQIVAVFFDYDDAAQFCKKKVLVQALIIFIFALVDTTH
ncbi:hypothetical protein [Campylobacter concisus]|uniref:hypothetical protein n=1 Tax=Campylobacter concisus TaxID=199 RepID=UPI0009D6543E|nr:hypothetical protein [Campylobacter concisus]